MLDLFRNGLNASLLNKPEFISFVEWNAKDIAHSHCAEIEFDELRSSNLAFMRYRDLYNNFKKALPSASASPNGFKIAASICFSLRRAQPIVSVRPSKELVEKQRKTGLFDKDGKRVNIPAYQYFYSYCDEIVAFQTGLRIAHYFDFEDVAQKRARLIERALTEEEYEYEFERLAPRLSPEFDKDLLITLRDHTNGPYTIYMLYRSIFALRESQSGART